MKTKPLFSLVLLATLPFVTGVSAQNASASATPSVAPAAVDDNASAPPAGGSNEVIAASNDESAALKPTQFIYAPRLPTAQELANVAAARGTPIDRIEQNANQVTVAYKQSNGQINVVAYQLIPSASTTGTTVVTPSPAPTVVTTPPPRVIYRPAPSVVYYDPFYDPWYYYPPVSLSLGFGFGGYYGGRHYYGGGFHHSYHGHR